MANNFAKVLEDPSSSEEENEDKLEVIDDNMNDD